MLPVSGVPDPSELVRIFAFLVSMITAGVTMLGVYMLIRLFRLYENDWIFTMENVKCFKNLGRVLVIWVVAKFIHTPLMSIALTFQNPPGQRSLVLLIDISVLTGNDYLF